MDKAHFREGALGKLQKISVQDEKDWTFIPDKLPTKWEIPGSLWPLLSDAKSALSKLDGVGKHLQEYQLLLRPLQRREALTSSSLEGTYATAQELLMYEINKREPKSVYDPINASREVANYNEALEIGLDLLDSLPISHRMIKRLHETLLSGVRGFQRDPGNYRKTQVHIGSNRRFIPPPPLEMKMSLDMLETYINSEPEIDPLLFCFMVHYQFETIHPFLDGNGRVGRLLLSIMIYQKCKLDKPWLYLSAFFDKHKEEYISNLYQVSTTGNWEDWFAYCLRAVKYQAKDSERRISRLIRLRANYIEKIKDKHAQIKLSGLIDLIFQTPFFTIPMVARQLCIAYATANSYVRLLEQENIVRNASEVLKGDFPKRPAYYIAPEIMSIAYYDE